MLQPFWFFFFNVHDQLHLNISRKMCCTINCQCSLRFSDKKCFVEMRKWPQGIWVTSIKLELNSLQKKKRQGLTKAVITAEKQCLLFYLLNKQLLMTHTRQPAVVTAITDSAENIHTYWSSLMDWIMWIFVNDLCYHFATIYLNHLPGSWTKSVITAWWLSEVLASEKNR